MANRYEILKELEVGEIYSARQMRIFTTYNDVMVLCDQVSEFTDDSNITFKVEDIFSSYLHQYKYPDKYMVPDRKKKVYIVKKIEETLW